MERSGQEPSGEDKDPKHRQKRRRILGRLAAGQNDLYKPGGLFDDGKTQHVDGLRPPDHSADPDLTGVSLDETDKELLAYLDKRIRPPESNK